MDTRVSAASWISGHLLPTVIAVCLVLFFAPLTAGTAEPPQPPGVNGIGWGQPIASVRGLEIVDSDGSTLFFKRPGEKLSYAEADMERVLYGFYTNRFFAAVMDFRGFVIYRRVLESLKIRHGRPDDNDNIAKRHVWKWNDVQIRLDWDIATGRGRLLHYFVPIALEREQGSIDDLLP